MNSARDMLHRLVQTAAASDRPIPGTHETPAMRRRRAARQTQRNVNAVIQEAQAQAELERLKASLIRQGKVAPMQRRDSSGELVTEWIGSPREFLAPFSEALQKVNLGNALRARDMRVKAEQQKEAAHYEQLGRAAAARGIK